MMFLSEIAQVISSEWVQFFKDGPIETIEIDSRKNSVSETSLFFALSGEARDGHEFLKQAHDKGIRNFIISKSVDPLVDSNVLIVPNVLSALQRLASHRRSTVNIPVIGITGSNGKTIVKEWLSWILSSKYQVVKSPKSYNSQIGVPLSVWGLNPTTEIGVFEAGISKVDEMCNLAEIINPTLGLITNIGEAHASGFSGIGQKLAEKLKLFSSCERIFYCKDHSMVDQAILKGYSNKGFSWSLTDQSANIYFSRSGNLFTTTFNNKPYRLAIRLNNNQDIENVLHALSVGIYLGLFEKDLNDSLERLKPVAMRLELKKGINQVYILDDSYNNDLAGLRIALEYMNQQPYTERKTVILSDIYQSGKDKKVLYEEVNALLIAHGIDRLVGVGEQISSMKSAFSIQNAFFQSTTELLQNLPAFVNELVLVKGARNFELEKVVDVLEEKSHGTVLEVNMESITHNLKEYRKLLSPTTKVMVMVKAFAYGGGLTEIAHLLQFHQVDYLGVAYLDEGIQLRRQGIRMPIMVMNPEWEHFSLLKEFDLEPEIYSLRMLEKYLEINDPPPIHIKMETGMNRLGVEWNELDQVLALLRQSKVHVAGIFTHFSSSDNPQHDVFTRDQAKIFEAGYEKLTKALGYFPLKHALNSSGISRWSDYQFDMVRLGIGLYGYDSSSSNLTLKTVTTLKTKISQIKAVKAGDTIGYNRVGKIERDSRIATLSIGYADGYLRAFSNGNAYVSINGKMAKTIGNVCMDMTMVDVTELTVNENDEVIVFGADPNIEQLAIWANTIPYEILTNIGQRVKRVFVSE